MSVCDDGSSNLAVFNEEEFITYSIADLAGANRAGYLSKEGKKGGVARYLKDKAEKEKEVQDDIVAATPTKRRQYRKPEEDASS